jgi:hypothetical protein
MFRNAFHAAVCGALCLVFGGCTTTSAQEAQAKPPQQALRVTYLVFSGRPNPTLTVTDPAQVRAIEEKLASARASKLRAEPAGEFILGYNGILIERVGAAPTASGFVVKRDVLRVEGSAEKSDASAAAPVATVSRSASDLEALLLSVGREQGVLDAALLSAIQDTK